MWGDSMKQFSYTLADGEKDQYRARLEKAISVPLLIYCHLLWCPLDQLMFSPGYNCLKIVGKRKREIVTKFLGSAYLKMGKLLPIILG